MFVVTPVAGGRLDGLDALRIMDITGRIAAIGFHQHFDQSRLHVEQIVGSDAIGTDAGQLLAADGWAGSAATVVLTRLTATGVDDASQIA